VITIPRGAYVPVFSPAAPVPAATGTSEPLPIATPDPPDRPVPFSRPMVAVGFLAIVLTTLLAAAVFSWRTAAPGAEASPRRSIAVLPFEHYSTGPADAMTAARLTDSVTTDLARLGTVSVVSRTTASGYADGLRSARDIATALDVDFILESTVTVVEGGRLRVVARLVSAERDRKVWVGEYEAPAVQIGELSRRIAAESAAGALQHDAAR